MFVFVCLFVCLFVLQSGEYSKVFASPLPNSGEYSERFSLSLQTSGEYSNVFASPLQKSGEYSKVFCFSSGLLGPFGPHHARARGSSCRLLRLSGLAQAFGTPMRMLAGARTALQTKRASRSQLSQVPRPPVAPCRMTGSASAQGVPTAAVKVVGGSGGGGTKKVGNRRRFGIFFLFFSGFCAISQISKTPISLERRYVF